MRKGFTLVELIFVIVIIGILAAAAIPKFKNLKQHAEVKNLVKTVVDAVSTVPATSINLMDLEGVSAADINLTDQVLELKGAGWLEGDDHNIYDYNITVNGTAYNIAEMNLSAKGREFNVSITCVNFQDAESERICKEDLNVTSSYFQQIRF